MGFNEILKRYFDYGISNVHTCFPAIVKKYDKDTRRAEVQPSLKRQLPNGDFLNLPILVDCPVIYPGTKEIGIHFPLKEKDEVLVICSERCLDSWKDNGGENIEDTDIRRFSLSDAVVIPGLQAIEFPDTVTDGFALHSDKKITFDTNKTSLVIEDEKVTLDNHKVKVEVKKDEIGVSIGNSKFNMKNNETKIECGNNKIEMSATGSVGITITGKGQGKIEVS